MAVEEEEVVAVVAVEVEVVVTPTMLEEPLTFACQGVVCQQRPCA